ncbi:hypothetical protein Tco_1349450 [Tanacetum coccineum]
MTTLVEFMIIAGADNRPPILKTYMYDSWKSRMELYIENRDNGRMILNSVQNGPLIWPTIVQEDGTTRTKKYEELSVTEKLQADCDLKATNTVLQGLPPDVYAIVNHHKVAKEIWDRVKLLMQGTKLSLQERECKVYDEFDMFSFVKGKTLYQYYRRFAQLIHNMNVINMSMRQVQVNTKFLKSLPPKWSKFVTDVKLDRDLHTTNYDQLYSYLEQHEAHENENLLMCERYQDPLALVANYNQPLYHLTNYHSQYNATQFPQQTNTMILQVHSPQSYSPMPLFKTAGLLCNKFKESKDKVMSVLEIRVMLLVPKETMQEGRQGLLNAIIVKTKDQDAYDSDYDDVSTTKAVLMANLSNYCSDVLSKVPHSKPYHNDMDNQSVHAMQDFKQTPVIDFLKNEIKSDSNIILYFQYLQETQQAAIQDTNLYAQQDS